MLSEDPIEGDISFAGLAIARGPVIVPGQVELTRKLSLRQSMLVPCGRWLSGFAWKASLRGMRAQLRGTRAGDPPGLEPGSGGFPCRQRCLAALARKLL